MAPRRGGIDLGELLEQMRDLFCVHADTGIRNDKAVAVSDARHLQLDRALERGTSVLGLLNQLERKRQERGEIPPGSDGEDGEA